VGWASAGKNVACAGVSAAHVTNLPLTRINVERGDGTGADHNGDVDRIEVG
jgi:hypothetical protein